MAIRPRGLPVLALLLAAGCGGEKGRLLKLYTERGVHRTADGLLHRAVVDDTSNRWIRAAVMERSSDGGETWERTHVVKTFPGYRIARNRDIGFFVDPGGTFHFVTGREKVIYVTSTDRGGTWGDLKEFDFLDEPTNPAVSVDGDGVIYVAYRGTLKVSRFGGEFWETHEIRDADEYTLSRGDDGTVYLAGIEPEKGMMFFLSQSADGGKTWRTNATQSLPIAKSRPLAAAFGGKVYIVFTGLVPDIEMVMTKLPRTWPLYYVRSEDAGQTWSGYILLREGKK